MLDHARGTLALARWAWRRIADDRLRLNATTRRAFLLAAIFHDVGKSADRGDHERAGAEIVLQAWPKQPLVAFLVLHHSGRWGPPQPELQQWLIDHQIIEAVDTQENRRLAELLAGADYIDAHRHQIWPVVKSNCRGAAGNRVAELRDTTPEKDSRYPVAPSSSNHPEVMP